MACELYPYDNQCVKNRPRRGLEITLGKNGELYLSPEAHAALGQPGSVRLLYDRAKRVLAIEATTEGDWHALRVWHHPRSERRRVSAKGFSAYCGLRPAAAQWYGGEIHAGVLHVPLRSRTRSPAQPKGAVIAVSSR